VLGCVARLLGDHRGQTIVVVTHGGVLDVIYRRALGLPSNAPRDYAIPNAGINWLTIDGEQWQIERWGETVHLGANESVLAQDEPHPENQTEKAS